MSLLSGNASISRFTVLGPVPTEDQLLEGLRQDAFRPFEDGLEEERMGWCDWRNSMVSPPNPDWISQDRFWVFSLRIDTRRVPSELLKAQVALRLEGLQKDKDLAFVGKEARVSIQDEVKAELLCKVLPVPKVFEVAWDFKGGVLLTTGTSSKAQSALIGLFITSFGVELQLISPFILAGRVAPHLSTEGLMALDPLDLTIEEGD